MSGNNFAKIKKIFPDIKEHEDATYLEELAERLDDKEEIEKFIKSDKGNSFRNHFIFDIATSINAILDNVSDHDKLIPIIERLRVLVGFYRNFSNAENDAETMRTMVDEFIKEIT